MNKFRFTIQLLAIAIFMFAFASFAQAQATRTWVSGVGDDANPCSRTAPCKTFAGAISKTAASGEIDCVDSGGFGAVTITKSITIDGTGVMAGILSAGTNGVNVNDVNSGSPNTIVVTLRALSINGAGTGINGINFTSGKAVNVIGCVIQGGTGSGINVSLNTTTQAQLTVTDCAVKKWGGDGISIGNVQNGAIRYTIERTLVAENNNGIHVKGANSLGTARNCVVVANTTNGVFADAVSGVAVIRLWSCQITGNLGNGVRSGNAGNAGIPVVEIAQNEIDQNAGTGVLVTAPGTVETFTNNSIKGNGTNGCTGCTGTGPGN